LIVDMSAADQGHCGTWAAFCRPTLALSMRWPDELVGSEVIEGAEADVIKAALQ
jgi:hypothetical protein